MELRQKLIELLNEVLDKQYKKVSKELLQHKKDRADIYEDGYDNLFSNIEYIVYELEQGKEGK